MKEEEEEEEVLLYLREQMEGLQEITLIHLMFSSLPQCQCPQTLVTLTLIITTILCKAEERHHLSSPSRGAAVLDKDGIGQDDDVWSGAAFAEAAGGGDGDMGRRDCG